MEEYISREAVIEALGEEPFGWAGTDAELQAMRDWEQFKAMVESIPTADVVPVVRCKDCKYFEDMKHYTRLGWCTEVGDTRSKDWYCADGERRDANDER